MNGSIPLSHPVKQKIKDALVALSLANLCYISAWFTILFDDDLGFFNNLLVAPPTLLALIVNIFGFALLVWLVMQALHRFQNQALHLIVHLVFFSLLYIVLSFFRSQILDIGWHLIPFLKQPTGMFIGAVIFALLLWKHRWIAMVLASGVACLFPLALLNLCKIALLCLGVIHLRQADNSFTRPPLNPVHENQPRVVWIIFDELDYRLVFEQPPAGFQFSEFHQLRDESLSATNAYPPADKTVISIPSLIAGRRVLNAELISSSDLSLTLYKTGSVVNCETTNWSKLPTVFSDARQLGVNTALIGWYLPYSRLLMSNLNYCVWFPMPNFEPARATTFSTALLRQIECLSGAFHIQQGFVQMHHDMMAQSFSVVTNGNYGLVLLHLFPPHGRNIYLPETDSFSTFNQPYPRGYFNNVVLADHSLGQLRRAMETSGQWDKTWVIISADHSWRKSETYDGKRDQRVPFLIKPAGVSTSATYSTQFNTAVTRIMIDAILRGEVTNQNNLGDWLASHGKPRPVSKGTFIEGSYKD